ncbi:MAG: hypothetical protein EOM23_09770 [Candidatus Moranbacteria bacterium]|nr:hypothetical protein [Candidatus Moranbacteria bacterium]
MLVSMVEEKIEVMISAEKIDERIREMAEAISKDYAGKRPLLIGVLKGAVIFLSDLIRYIQVPVEIDFAQIPEEFASTFDEIEREYNKLENLLPPKIDTEIGAEQK